MYGSSLRAGGFALSLPRRLHNTLIALSAAAFIAAPGEVAAQQKMSAPSAPVLHFDITEFRVDGNSVLSEDEIDRAVYGFLGPNKTADDVEKARAALDALYARKGYPTVSTEIPAQHVTNGLVVLKVTERTIGRLRVTGSRYFDQRPIRHGAPALAEGKVPNMRAVQSDVLALNQWPDRTVAPTVRAGAAPDTVDVDLDVKDTLPLHASVELNNRRSADTTSLRTTATLSYDNLWQRGDSASISYNVAPQNTADASVVSGSYLFRLPSSPLSLLFSYLHSDSNVSTVGSTTVVGKGDIAGVRLLVPLGFEDGFVHSLSIGGDYKRFFEEDRIAGTLSYAPVTYWPLSTTYQASWSGDSSQTNLIANVMMAAREFGSNPSNFDNKRAYAQGNFIYLRNDLTRTQNLPYDIQLYGHVTAQITGDALVSSEQFSLGGLDTVRGYLESEFLGDKGGAFQGELRGPSVAPYIGWPVNEARAFAFFDVGAAAINKPLAEQVKSYTFSSTGVGLRVQLFDYLYGEVADAFALDQGPNTKSGANRVLFRVYGEF